MKKREYCGILLVPSAGGGGLKLKWDDLNKRERGADLTIMVGHSIAYCESDDLSLFQYQPF